MTYTFKIARRLAVSRDYTMLACIAVLLACSGEATAPEPADQTPEAALAFRVVPGAVTLETHQTVRFRTVGIGANRTGRFRGEERFQREFPDLPVEWEATGGAIDEAGLFTASEPGTYRVVGRGRGRGKPDTSVVVVVPPQPNLAQLTISPASVTLEPGTTHAFAAVGILSDGSTAPIGVTWQATGGSIDPDGLYTAGSAAGGFRVIASNTEGTVADTSAVTIAAVEPPPPPPVPTLAQVVLLPANATLTVGATKQFAAYGRNSVGDSVSVAVSFSASGGTISGGGLYTAGGTRGTYRVVATVGGIADTAVVSLTEVALPTTGGGMPFGPASLLSGTSNTTPFTMGLQGVSASTILTRLSEARASKVRLVLNMTGGSHDNYLTDGVFDRSKWQARMNTYNTAAIRQAIADAVADGTIIGNSVMDEPHVSGQGDGNTWGPEGTMTKARVDSLCRAVKTMFPTLPVGVAHRHDSFEPTKSYRVCEFIISQYSSRLGSVTEFRDGGLAMARRDGHAILFAMNILNGGTQDRDGTWNCAGTGGMGTYAPNCAMTPAQVREYAYALGPAGCGLSMWRYDAAYMANLENQRAFKDVATRMASVAPRPCRRP